MAGFVLWRRLRRVCALALLLSLIGQAAVDAAPKANGRRRLTISDATVTEGNSGSTTATFLVTLTQAATIPVSVNYATAPNTASSPSDFTTAAGTLNFAPGELSKEINVTVVGDL